MEAKEIYKLVSQKEWSGAQEAGEYSGSELDKKDGFIHLSTASQCKQTARLHYGGREDVLLVEVSTEKVRRSLRWDPAPSRNNELFPHIYGVIPMDAVTRVAPLPLTADGHTFPSWFPS